MNKIWIIIQREFKNRVFKKSFLLATFLVPLIFPTIISVMAYLAINEERNAAAKKVYVFDESGHFDLANSHKFEYIPVEGPLDSAKEAYRQTGDFGLLHIPAIDLDKPEGLAIFTTESPGMEQIRSLEWVIRDKIMDVKLVAHNLDEEVINGLRPSVDLKQYNLNEAGGEVLSSSGLFYGLGFVLGMLIYMFVMIYGVQIMQGVIDEKTSKVVEVIVSSVKPFQLMAGKIIGVASVGLLQFTIWIVLIGVLSSGVMSYMGVVVPQKTEIIESVLPEEAVAQQQSNPQVMEILQQVKEVPMLKVAVVFLFYFLGGYLLYGALFAAVGSSVDSLHESQQFQFPITIPLLMGYMGLFMFTLRDPHGQVSFWLSIIPLTSPVAMVGRIAYGVPAWQLILSISMLVGGFILTTWIAGRIYRVGILRSGAKVNYKVLVKWFLSKG